MLPKITLSIVPRWSFSYCNEGGIASIDLGCLCLEIEFPQPAPAQEDK